MKNEKIKFDLHLIVAFAVEKAGFDCLVLDPKCGLMAVMTSFHEIQTMPDLLCCQQKLLIQFSLIQFNEIKSLKNLYCVTQEQLFFLRVQRS